MTCREMILRVLYCDECVSYSTLERCCAAEPCTDYNWENFDRSISLLEDEGLIQVNEEYLAHTLTERGIEFARKLEENAHG